LGPGRGWILGLLVVAVVAVVAVVLNPSPARQAAAPPPAVPDAASRNAPPPPTRTDAAPAAGSCVQDRLDAMSPRARVGQLFLLGVPANGTGRLDRIVAADLPGGVFLTGRGSAGAAATARLLAGVQDTEKAAGGDVGMFAAVDQEGGQVQVLTGSGFSTMPSAVVQGGWSSAQLQAAATEWGRQLRSAGVNVDLAPVGDVLAPGLGDANAAVGKSDRTFGTDPEKVAAHVTAFVRGMQAAQVASTAKHFPGLGQVRGNTDFTAGITDTQTTATSPDLGSFSAAAQSGVAWTMISLATYSKIDPSQPAVFSEAVLRILREQLGFRGLVVSDDLGNAVQVASVPPGQRSVRFIAAGGDVVLTAAPGTLTPMIDAVLATSAGDHRFAEQVTAAERRVMLAKQSMGLLPCG
jgi:beta-N-acetylhexosaminidase